MIHKILLDFQLLIFLMLIKQNLHLYVRFYSYSHFLQMPYIIELFLFASLQLNNVIFLENIVLMSTVFYLLLKVHHFYLIM